MDSATMKGFRRTLAILGVTILFAAALIPAMAFPIVALVVVFLVVPELDLLVHVASEDEPVPVQSLGHSIALLRAPPVRSSAN